MNDSNPPLSSSEPPGFSPESWDFSRDYAALFGQIPSSFSTAIRSMMFDTARSGGVLTKNSRFLVERLVHSPTLKACLYFAARTYRPKQLEALSNADESALIDLFSPQEIVGIIGVTYLFRRARRLCDPSYFVGITNRLQHYAELGMHLGIAIPRIAPLYGLLAGAVPFLGFGPFLFHDRKGFTEYARHLKKTDKPSDYHFELQRWGCSSIQIGAVLMQTIGFGVPLSFGLAHGAVARSLEGLQESDDAYRFRCALTWMDALDSTGLPPNITHRGEFYPTKAALQSLIGACETLRTEGSPHCWLLRNGHDLNAESAPELLHMSAAERLRARNLSVQLPDLPDAPKAFAGQREPTPDPALANLENDFTQVVDFDLDDKEDKE